ncbi:cytochrome c family protein [Dongia sp.]|uniref:c-type cytochrome n=1 Tax=Dongia sp. TaxID=1977262 RepID=UPI0035AED351
MLRSSFTAATIILTTTLCATAASYAVDNGDPTKGKKIFARCAACHSVEADVNKIGPSLHGIIGRPAGTIADFKYSDAMKSSGLTWDPDTLDKYLTKPKELIPGNKMIFPGLPKPTDRADLISYLQEAAGAAQ